MAGVQLDVVGDVRALDAEEAVFEDRAPLPPLFVIVPGTALDRFYGASARAALRKTARSGWCEASNTRTRRVLRMTFPRKPDSFELEVSRFLGLP